jgi:hypothetical protein
VRAHVTREFGFGGDPTGKILGRIGFVNYESATEEIRMDDQDGCK